jgi:antibiotic biosynthesis monooxygenase (ABM) superfamily enzyme
MIYVTQLIYIKEGYENIFREFEKFAIELMTKYRGKMIHRIKPSNSDFMSIFYKGGIPNEIQIIRFSSEKNFRAYLKDDKREKLRHLKDNSVRSTLMIQGKELMEID